MNVFRAFSFEIKQLKYPVNGLCLYKEKADVITMSL